MDKLRALKYFVKVADTLSFTEAAKAYDVPASSISRRISELETSIGTVLLHRTTRTVSLTEAGKTYLAQVRLGLTQLAAADVLLCVPIKQGFREAVGRNPGMRTAVA